jgi:two-component system nitrate/nitrite sensor histidine kinase NarX
MGKKTSSVKNSVPAGFSWAKDPGLAPPDKRGSATMHDISVPLVTQTAQVKSLLEALLESLIDSANASCGIIRLLSPHGQTLQLISSAGLPEELLEAERAADSNCQTCNKSFEVRGIYSAKLRACRTPQDCRYAGNQIQSLICASIENNTTPNKPFGILTLFFSKAQEPFELTSKTVLAFARLLGAVIEHNKSNRDAKRTDLIAERQAIANEIHDSLAQSLVYTRMRTSLLLEAIRTRNELMVIKYAHDIDEALENSQKTVRELITDFRCSMDPSGLLHALQTLTAQFCHRNKIILEYYNRVPNLELPLEYEIQVYHIVREALANIATHSGATHARLIAEFSGNYYVFTIEDNGSGGCTFTPVEGHYGMMIMRERAQRIGGEIKVESSKGFGTRVQLLLPEPGSNWRAVNE